MTIGDHVQISGASSIEEILRRISDSRFNPKYLGRFEHLGPLRECCLQAVADLAGEAFDGNRSFANVMGRAMGLLRERHSVNAPRGWVPVMRALRAAPPPWVRGGRDSR
jgi:hypothetical protein